MNLSWRWEDEAVWWQDHRWWVLVLSLEPRQFSTCDIKYDVVWTLLIYTIHVQLKENNIAPFHLSRKEGHLLFLSMLSIVWWHRVSRESRIARHLSCVIISLIQDCCLNKSWRTYYWCNSPLRDSSLAERPEYRWQLPETPSATGRNQM